MEGPATDRRVYTIGRYEVAGHLATGGMAEILLGRVVGPAGFERPVVIKRILPHLAKDENFRRMFLDEARIAARIRHPNVVQVQDLIEEEGELFIVMEYLEGESLSGVIRRLSRRERVLPAPLCAWVGAEAAAGLHAAHELVDDDGGTLALVHRDVSPQNVFITYDGRVKILDFGIAKGKHHDSRTQTGELKGKFEYMSPEQATAKDLDRRSDVFSLGTVLWEMSTGHRLFKRKNQLLTFKAITSAPVEPPPEIVPGYPRILSQACLKALKRRRSDRFQTAAAMRRDLTRALSDFAPDVVADETLSDLMHDLFGERIEEKREMLKRLQTGSQLTHLPSPEVDPAVELPTLAMAEDDEDPSLSDPGTMGTGAYRDALREPEAGRRRGTVVLAVVAAAALGAVGLWVSSTGDEAAATADDETADEVVAGVVAETTAEPARSGNVRIHVESTPPGATVRLGDRVLGETPTDFELPVSEDPAELTLSRGGYAVETVSVVPDVAQRLRLELRRVRRERRRRPRRAAMSRMPVDMKAATGYHRFD